MPDLSRDAVVFHDALTSVWARLYDEIDGARFERRSDLIVAVCPGFPFPQCNGPWVMADSHAAVDALSAALSEVEAAGELPWVQTRSGQVRTQAAGPELGLTHVERLPAMIAYADELATSSTTLEIRPIADAEIAETSALLALAFGAPEEIFARFAAVRAMPEATWYVGRLDGRIISTALGVSVDGATGIRGLTQPAAVSGLPDASIRAGSTGASRSGSN